GICLLMKQEWTWLVLTGARKPCGPEVAVANTRFGRKLFAISSLRTSFPGPFRSLPAIQPREFAFLHGTLPTSIRFFFLVAFGVYTCELPWLDLNFAEANLLANSYCASHTSTLAKNSGRKQKLLAAQDLPRARANFHLR